MYNGGAVYNHHLAQLDKKTATELAELIAYRKGLPLWRKILSAFTLVDWELKLKAAVDIIDARKNPHGETAKKINPKLEAYRQPRTLFERLTFASN